MNKFTFNQMAAPLSLWMFCSLIIVSPSVHAITKCKDAEGKWHYGDLAVRECEDSKITTLSERGFIIAEKAAPKTDEELLKIEKEIEKKQAEDNQRELEDKERQRLLDVYETEDDIDRQRDNQLYSVDSNIAVHNSFLESLNERIVYEEGKFAGATNPVIKDHIRKKIDGAQKDVEIYSKEVEDLKRQNITDIESYFAHHYHSWE